MSKDEQKGDFYPFMKVTLGEKNGVVTSELRTSEDRSHYGVIRWDTSKETDIEDWRGLWGTFVSMGGREIGLDYQFRFINDDGTLKEVAPTLAANSQKNKNPAASFKIRDSFNIITRGLAAYGIVLEGRILPGYSTIIDISGQPARVKIRSWGMGRADENGNMQWGLILEFENKELEKIARTDKIKEQIIAIYRDTISVKDLNTVLEKLQQAHNGKNYQASFGIEIFNNCQTLQEVKSGLKDKFPHSKPESIVPVPITEDEFWKEIEYALEYRGDESHGIQFSEAELKKYFLLKEAYTNFLRASIEPDSEFYSYPDETGIPGYPVFWDFRLIILTKGANALFVYGSASD